MTYDEWLALSDDERDHVHHKQWDVYKRDGYLIAMMAAVRMASSCDIKVFDVGVGTYHGGEHVLHLTVHDESLPTLPAPLAQRFEGFRVVWMPSSRLGILPPAKDHLGGVWRHEDDDTDVEFTFDVSTTPPGVEARCISDGEHLIVSNVVGNDQWLSFTTTVPSNGYIAEHVVSATETDTAIQRLTFRETWIRVEG